MRAEGGARLGLNWAVLTFVVVVTLLARHIFYGVGPGGVNVAR